MQLRLEQLETHLGRAIAPLYLLYGSEPLFVMEAADQIRAHAKTQGYSERSLFVVSAGFAWEQLTLASKNLSLFSGKKIIDLRIPTGKPGKEGSEALQRYCEQLTPDILTLITLPALDWSTQKTVWFETLRKTAVSLELNTPSHHELPRWIASRLARQNQRADSDTLQFLADRVEGNLLAAHQEVQKLALLFSEGELSFEQIKDVVLNVARYDVFQLNEALLGGDISRLAHMLNGLQAEGEAPPLALWAMTEEIRILIKIQTGKEAGKSSSQLFKENRVWGARQKLIEHASKRLTRPTLQAALAHAAQIDRMIKGWAKGNVWDELLQLGLRFRQQA